MQTTPTTEKHFPQDEAKKIPAPFILRRLHSVLGLGLVLYLFEHLLVNSRVAFYFQDDGAGFINMVNGIHSIPYLKVVEILLLAFPFLFHGIWGIFYAKSAKLNSYSTDGRRVALPQYVRNRAFSWQRITSYILLFFILGHVIQMRFLDYPQKVSRGLESQYLVHVGFDKGLYGMADKLGLKVFTLADLLQKKQSLEAKETKLDRLSQSESKERAYYALKDEVQEDREWVEGAQIPKLKKNQVVVQTPDAGRAFLLIVRNTFKSPLMVLLYSVLVIASAYHGLNGLWTFCITWGLTLTRRSQARLRRVVQGLIILVSAMGLAAAWGMYYIVQIQQ